MRYHGYFTTRFLKNIVVSKQAKNVGTVLGFFDQQKVSVTSNTNNWATYTANKELIKAQNISFVVFLLQEFDPNQLVWYHVLEFDFPNDVAQHFLGKLNLLFSIR